MPEGVVIRNILYIDSTAIPIMTTQAGKYVLYTFILIGVSTGVVLSGFVASMTFFNLLASAPFFPASTRLGFLTLG